MMMDSLSQEKKNKTPEARQGNGAQIKNALFYGLWISVAAILLWFLLSESAKSIGSAILILTAAMAVLDTLVFMLVKSKPQKQKIPVIVILAILNAVVFLSVSIYALAGTQIFYPHFDESAYAALQTREDTEELTLETETGTVSGWMLHNAEPSAPLVIYFYGNGENAATRMLRLIDKGLIEKFAGCNLAILDYPGYGKSDGVPSEKTLKAFGLAVYDALAQRSDVDEERIVIFGYSLGTGVADYVASKRETAGLILMAPYADGYDLYNGMVDIFHGPARLLVAFKMESVQFAESVSVRPLILASQKDEMVHYESSVRLSQAFPEGCTFKTFEDLSHNDFWGSATVLQDIADYIAEVKAG